MHSRSTIDRLEKMARDYKKFVDLLHECENSGSMAFATLVSKDFKCGNPRFDYDDLPAEVQEGLRKALAGQCAKHMIILERDAALLGFNLKEG